MYFLLRIIHAFERDEEKKRFDFYQELKIFCLTRIIKKNGLNLISMRNQKTRIQRDSKTIYSL
jgi:hypothetical protein